MSSTSMSPTEAARRLCITKERVRQLLAQGLLETDPGDPKLISSESVEVRIAVRRADQIKARAANTLPSNKIR